MDPTSEECEQLARSITMSPSLTRDAQLRVVDLLRELGRRVAADARPRAPVAREQRPPPDRYPGVSGASDAVETG